ncbi:MAG: carbon monoxide dehydrogenase, partial [Acidimicrobiaceae bacterium]
NDAAHRAVLKGEGRDSTGKGNASAIITAQLESVDANTTRCTVNTDLTITGKIAQFGRGALADVSDKLLKQFVVNLESTVLAQELSNTTGAGVSAADDKSAVPAGAAGATGAPGATTAPGAQVENAPLNLLGSTGLSLALPILKRALPVLVAIAAIVWFVLR